MNRNGYVLITIFVLLGAAYVYFFTELFDRDTIQIIPQLHPGSRANASGSGDVPPTYPVQFLFNRKLQITSLKVVAAQDLATNKYANPAWHLISDSNSIPTKNVIYGHPIKGMKPAIARMRPEPLQPNVAYVLFVEAGKVKGQTNFFTKEIASGP